MSNKKSSRAVFGICVLIVSVLCTALRIISTLLFFDTDIGYYQAGKIIPLLSYAVPAAAVIAAMLFCFIPKIRLAPIDAYDTIYTRVCAILPAIGFAAFSVMYILSLVEYSTLQSQIPFSFILCALCSVAAAVFFALKALNKQANTAVVICGILTVLWLVLALAQSYFDTFVTMNSPLKTVFQFACLSAMLFVLCEMRMGIDGTRKRLHMLAAAAAVILLPLSAIPSLLGLAAALMPQSYTLVYYDITLLAIAVAAVSRLVNLCFGKDCSMTVLEADADCICDACSSENIDTEKEQQ